MLFGIHAHDTVVVQDESGKYVVFVAEHVTGQPRGFRVGNKRPIVFWGTGVIVRYRRSKNARYG